MALRLRPGLVIARRDDSHLQIGLDPPLCAVLPATADVQHLLAALADGAPLAPTTPAGHRALQALREADLLVEAETVAANPLLAMQYADGAAARVAARSAASVGVEAPTGLRQVVEGMLRTAGLRPRRDPAVPSVIVVADDGPVRRSRVDQPVRDGIPHLLVSGAAHGWIVGPFVVPGVTACVRCVDAALGERDPRRATVLEQVARAPAPPTDPVLRSMALAWAVRDVRSWIDGDRPTTWSATVTIAASGAPEVHGHVRHPHCGCAWDLVLSREEE